MLCKEHDSYLENTWGQWRTGPIAIGMQDMSPMVQWWHDVEGWWHDQLVTRDLGQSWYKMWHCVSLFIQSILLTTTQQLPNNCLLLSSNMPMLNSCTFQSASGLNTITRPPPKRSGGDYPSGQQVIVTNLVSFWLKTDLFWPRSMIWSLLTSLWLRSSRLLGWTITCGFKPSSITKS